MTVSLLRPSADSWVAQAAPNANNADAPRLHLSGTTDAIRRGFIWVGRPFPLDATIFEARLRLRLASTWTGQTLNVRRVTQSWGVNKLTWANQPDTSATNAGSANLTGSAGDVIEVDITNMLGDVAAGGAWFGLRLAITDNLQRSVWSADASIAATRPEVEIEWGELPEAPTNLVPGGGQAVSIAQPVLSWQFGERGSNAASDQASSQVQISDDPGDFSSPEYDSGWQANTESSWDLDGTAFSIADTETWYWRVRVRDEANQESGWSDVEEFTRVDQGSLAITNPPAPPDNEVEETSPPIAWTLSDATQESFALTLYESAPVDFGFQEIYRVPRTVTTDEVHTIPPQGFIKSGKIYYIQLRVWDDVDRAATVGDVPYVEEFRGFTYERSGSPAAVTALTATADQAKVVLEWTRTTQPDYFALVVDGEEVETRIDPTEVSTGGSSYEMDYWGAQPGTEHTYEIEAVVHDLGVFKHSDGNATDSATTDPSGIWLVDPEDGTTAKVIGPSWNLDLSIREIGTTFELAGSRRPVRITDAVMGYSGSASGHVHSKAERDNWLRFKGNLKPLRLIANDLNIEVVLEEIGAKPHGEGLDDAYFVSADFFQTDAEQTFNLTGG